MGCQPYMRMYHTDSRSWFMLLALCVVGCGVSCSESEKSTTWGGLEYEQDQALTSSEQVAVQRALQANHRSVTGPYQVSRTTLFSDTMTEKERRKFQEKAADRIRQRAEDQMKEDRLRRAQQVDEQRKVGRSSG